MSESSVKFASLAPCRPPHIVNFHDFLELPGETVAVVMDYVQGQTLAEVLADQPDLSLDRALQFGLEIASGLATAHERGAVHRDLKPANVMVRNLEGDQQFVQLIDFGVARFEHEASRTVGFVGTPRYTSPEQARRERAEQIGKVRERLQTIQHSLDSDERVIAEVSTPITALAVHNAQRVLLGQCDGTIRVLDLHLRQVDEIGWAVGDSPVTALAESPGQKLLVAGFENGKVAFRDQTLNSGWKRLPRGAEVRAVATCQDGSSIAVGREDGTTDIYIPERSTQDYCARINHEDDPERVVFSPDGHLVAIQSDDGRARLFSALNGTYRGEADASLLAPVDVFERAETGLSEISG